MLFINRVFAAPTDPPSGITNSVAPDFTIGELISDSVSFIIILAFIIAFFFLLWGGFQWITSGGDESQVEAARSRIIQAIIGLTLVVGAWAIFGFVSSFFGVDFTLFKMPRLGKDSQEENLCDGCEYLNLAACSPACAGGTCRSCDLSCPARFRCER